VSNWTHVAGIMRVDAIRPLGGKYNFTEIMPIFAYSEIHATFSDKIYSIKM